MEPPEAAPNKTVCVMEGMTKIDEDRGMNFRCKEEEGEEEKEEKGEFETQRILEVSSTILHPTKWRM
jgi:hypothetical protein